MAIVLLGNQLTIARLLLTIVPPARNGDQHELGGIERSRHVFPILAVQNSSHKPAVNIQAVRDAWGAPQCGQRVLAAVRGAENILCAARALTSAFREACEGLPLRTRE